jgi:hypothetical protein
MGTLLYCTILHYPHGLILFKKEEKGKEKREERKKGRGKKKQPDKHWYKLVRWYLFDGILLPKTDRQREGGKEKQNKEG